jgi:DNA-binding NtrC family response regulator
MSSLPHRVLVVAPTPGVAERVLGCLGEQEIVVRTDFASARRELDEHPPDLIVTEVRLGAFNGLHLAIRAHGRGVATQTIVVGTPDPVLQAEALHHHAAYITTPVDEATLSATMHELLAFTDATVADAAFMTHAGHHGRHISAAF